MCQVKRAFWAKQLNSQSPLEISIQKFSDIFATVECVCVCVRERTCVHVRWFLFVPRNMDDYYYIYTWISKIKPHSIGMHIYTTIVCARNAWGSRNKASTFFVAFLLIFLIVFFDIDQIYSSFPFETNACHSVWYIVCAIKIFLYSITLSYLFVVACSWRSYIVYGQLLRYPLSLFCMASHTIAKSTHSVEQRWWCRG